MIKQQQTLKQQQKLSPLQVQQVKLLELNSLEIENRIQHELEENPALEEADTAPDTDEPDLLNDAETEKALAENTLPEEGIARDEDIADYIPPRSAVGQVAAADIFYAKGESFQDYLSGQLQLKKLTPTQFQIGEYIIGSLDSNGYLQRDTLALRDDLAFRNNLDVETKEVDSVLQVVRTLDPAGVGAVNLRDCLLLQLRRKEPTAVRATAIRLLDKYFDPFSKKQYERIRREMNLSEDDLRTAIREITQLNPKPGNSWENNVETKMGQITPDFYVETAGGEITLSMAHQNIPDLHVSPEYDNLLRQYETNEKPDRQTREAITFVKEKIETARWFIDALQQRNRTLQQTMTAIIRLQRDFFLSGDESDLKPMLLKDVAEAGGYDISTVSRVCSSKYVQTNWGIFSLKYFFSEQAATTTGEEMTIREIKTCLKSLVDTEDKKEPLTDDALTEQLRAKGFDIARRTVAKYREQMNIPTARLRREA